MKHDDDKTVRDAITDEAAEWFQTMRGERVSRATRARFAEWLIRSPQHTEEYLEMAALWDDLAGLDSGHRADVEALVAEVKRDANVESLFPGETGPAARRRLWPASVAAALALAAGGMLWLLGGDGERTSRYATSLGEQRSFALEDGSLVHLNTQSEIRVHMTAAERRVELLRGEALFAVAADPERPFRVDDRNVVVRALGTRFNVYRRPQSTRVTVIEGKVAVSTQASAAGSGAGGQATVELSPGEQAEGRAGVAALRTSVVDLERVTAWTTRRLVFESERLAAIVGEFNRYNQIRIVLDDPTLAALEIGGVFNADDPQSLVEVVESLTDIETRKRADGSLLLSRPASE